MPCITFFPHKNSGRFVLAQISVWGRGGQGTRTPSIALTTYSSMVIIGGIFIFIFFIGEIFPVPMIVVANAPAPSIMGAMRMSPQQWEVTPPPLLTW